jgi:hypothetical protein
MIFVLQIMQTLLVNLIIKKKKNRKNHYIHAINMVKSKSTNTVINQFVFKTLYKVLRMKIIKDVVTDLLINNLN